MAARKHPKKQPKAVYKLKPSKIPHAKENPEKFWKEKPSWRISMLEMCAPFGWHKIDRTALDSIRQKLGHFESMTWNDILIKGNKQNHRVSRNKLSRDAQQRLEILKQDDIDELVSLHLSGKERIWGILESDVLRLLWWDPNHKVYPVQKKHT